MSIPWLYLRNLCLIQSHKDILLFSARSFLVLGLNLGVLCEVSVGVLFAWGCPLVPAPFDLGAALSQLGGFITPFLSN